jgi:hypothetical protein
LHARLLLLLHGLLHHARVHELSDVVELVVLPCVGDGLSEGTTHGNVVGEVGSKTTIEVGILSLQMCGQATVLHGQVVVFFLVHLLIDDILLGDTQGASCTALVDLRSASCRLDTGFQTAITSTRGSDVCSANSQYVITGMQR